MLNTLIHFALRQRVLIVLLSLLVLFYGSYVALTLPIDVFPDLDRPRVVVMTEAPGLAPDEVETLITYPLESNLLGASGVQTVRSQSGLGLSVIYVEFDWKTDIRLARQIVQERLSAAVGSLPPDVRPQMAPIASIMGQIMHVGVHLRSGPQGGELAPVGKSGYLAELTHEPRSGRITVTVWNPTPRADPRQWRKVPVDATPPPVLTWNRTGPNSPGKAAQLGTKGERVELRAVPGESGKLAAQALRTDWGENSLRFTDLDRQLELSVGGSSYTIDFPAAASQMMALRTTADWVLRPRLLKIAGIAQVMVMGGGRKQYQVLVNPTALLAYDVTLHQVEQALRDNNLNASGSYAIRGGREQPIRVLGRLGPRPEMVLREIEQIPVKTTAHRTVLLHQVARVVEGAQFKRGDSSVNGHPAVVLTVTKQPHIDTRALTDQVTAALDEAEEALPANVVINPELFQLKGFIDRGIYNVGEALVIGAVLVLIVLFLFLLNFRTTFISLTAIPISLAITALTFQMVSHLTGVPLSINVMTLGGIAVALGELVDDAIVDVENIFRRLRENNALPLAPGVAANPGPAQLAGPTVGAASRAAPRGSLCDPSGPARLAGPTVGAASRAAPGEHSSPSGPAQLAGPPEPIGPAQPPGPTEGEGKFRRPALQVIYEASMEIRSAIVFGTAVVILVFLPLFALSGVEGRLFAPLGTAYIVSILASLLVSLTVTPVLSYYLLPQSQATHREKDSPLLRFLKWAAGHVIRFSMSFPGLILTLTWVLVLVSGWQLTRLGADFLPPFDEGSVQVNVTLPAGSSLEASNEAAAVVDARLTELQKSPEHPSKPILQFSRRTGRAELDEHAEPVSNTEYILTINPAAGHNREAIIKEVREDLRASLPGADVEVEQPLAHLISHMLSGVTAQIAIKVHGDDLDVLRRVASQIKNAIADIKGIAPPVVEAQQLIDELHIRVRPDKLALYGISRRQVAEFVQTALKGEEVSEVLEGQKRFDLLVRLDEPYRTDYANLGRLRLELPDGRGQIALEELASIGPGLGANVVNRENVRRRIVIRVNAQGRDLASVVQDIQNRVDDRVRADLPAGYFIEYGGQFESQTRATYLIAVLAFVSFIGMFVVLYLLFPSVRIVLQILNALPTAFIGGVLALVLTGQTLTVASLVGFISLGGIAVRNGILLVTHYIHLMQQEGEQFTQHMVLRGSLERLAPVLMTALTAGIGLVPLVVEGQAPGREILYPVATVILGGLITSTFCEFFLHPGLFWRFSGQDADRLAHNEEAEELLPAH